MNSNRTESNDGDSRDIACEDSLQSASKVNAFQILTFKFCNF